MVVPLLRVPLVLSLLLVTPIGLASTDVSGPDPGPVPSLPFRLCPITSSADVDARDGPLACPPAIRPGAASNSCTLNFVVTDGIDLFIGAAGHCADVGKRLTVAGVPGEVGTAVLDGQGGDWAFFRIDPEDHVYVDATMCGFGGPTAGPMGAHRKAVPGEPVLHYGHGASLGQIEETKGRAGAPAIPFPLLGGHSFAFVGSVDGGDSGSPVRAVTGEALGIAVAAVLPGAAPTLVIASDFTSAVDELADALGRPVWTVEGRPQPEWLEGLPPVPGHA